MVILIAILSHSQISIIYYIMFYLFLSEFFRPSENLIRLAAVLVSGLVVDRRGSLRQPLRRAARARTGGRLALLGLRTHC